MGHNEQVRLTNMCMVTDGNGNVLVQDRADPNWPGIVYPGGHVEYGESFRDSVIREVREETGIVISNPKLVGVKQFQTETGIRYIVFLYCADQWTGTLQSSDEGEAMWIPRAALMSQRLANGFEGMLPVFEQEEISELFYDGDKAVYF